MNQVLFGMLFLASSLVSAAGFTWNCKPAGQNKSGVVRATVSYSEPGGARPIETATVEVLDRRGFHRYSYGVTEIGAPFNVEIWSDEGFLLSIDFLKNNLDGSFAATLTAARPAKEEFHPNEELKAAVNCARVSTLEP